MRPLRYSINVSLDGCCDHAGPFIPDGEMHDYFAEELAEADALIFGRVVYQMMEEAWRRAPDGSWPDWMDWNVPFAESIDGAKKYVASTTLDQVDWNAELLQGDVVDAVRRLKEEPGDLLHTGGRTFARALADAGLIDEYEFVVHPVVVGRGPTLFADLREPLRLELTSRHQFRSGAVAYRYVPIPPAD